MSKKISLVLGSGGARGLAHVGIIRYLEEHGYTIESIAGCSIGALIGGFYAAGKLQNYVEWLENLETFDMLKLLDFKGSGGLVSGSRLMAQLEKLLGNPDIEKLPINFTAVATDIDAQKEVWINKGSLLDAIRASISLPLFFTPFEYQGKVLIDGGVLNPVPIAPTFHDQTQLTIAVNLGGENCHGCLQHISKDSKKGSKLPKSWRDNLQNYFTKLNLPESFVNENNMYAVVNKSFDTMQKNLARMKLSAYPADVEIDIPIDLCGTFDFHKAKEVIEFGYSTCKAHPEI